MSVALLGIVPRARLTTAIDGGTAPHLRPILEACRDHGCGWATVPQRSGRFVIPVGRPTILVVGDDMEEALGVGGFSRKSLRKFVSTCAGAVLVSCAPQIQLYAEAAAIAAVRRRNAVLVETRLEREAEWLAFLREVRSSLGVLVGTVGPARRTH